MSKQGFTWLVIIIISLMLLGVRWFIGSTIITDSVNNTTTRAQGMGKQYVKDVQRTFIYEITPPPAGSSPSDPPSFSWEPTTPEKAEKFTRASASMLAQMMAQNNIPSTMETNDVSSLERELDGGGFELSDEDRQQILYLAQASRTYGWVDTINIDPKQYYEHLAMVREGTAPTLPAVSGDSVLLGYRLDFWRTFGIWIGALCTLAIFSFLISDNPLYKIAEAVVIGVSAAYWMVVNFWDMIINKLMIELFPVFVRTFFTPGSPDVPADWWYLIPLILSIMLLWRLSPRGGWISRWPLAFTIGTFAGLRLMAFLEADFLTQISTSILPFVVMDWMPTGANFDLGDTVKNVLLVIGILSCLTYFFFSIEHKGFVGGVSRVGIWFLMITFGAAFGFTVMGRIALLAIRLEYLFDDWLWLIDPTNQRTAFEIVSATGLLFH